MEVNEFVSNQEAPVAALQILFDLLEGYAPAWYTEEHHKMAFVALQRSKQQMSSAREENPDLLMPNVESVFLTVGSR
jgi:hypothetical protein